MKPFEARRRRAARIHAKAMHSERMQAALADTPDRPTPHLVPDEPDRVHTLREYRRMARLAAGEAVGSSKFDRYLDRMIVELVRLIWIERVLALDPLERAALTPARLVVLSMVEPGEIKRRLGALQDGSEVTG